MPYRAYLPAETWGWLLFKLTLGIGWSLSMMLVTPPSIAENVSRTSLSIWTISTLVGALLSIVGMFMAASGKERRALRGLSVECVGIVLFAGGPVQYLFLQLGFITTEPANRIALAFFAAAMIVAIGIRGMQVGRAFYREATSPFKSDET